MITETRIRSKKEKTILRQIKNKILEGKMILKHRFETQEKRWFVQDNLQN
jgi:hypothetical protein